MIDGEKKSKSKRKEEKIRKEEKKRKGKRKMKKKPRDRKLIMYIPIKKKIVYLRIVLR